ncbi:chorismate mutase [Streptomyces sp. SD31]|uniref:chorismate mutase n=1 Tax=Streptomyces sp. SD31 TaxID=3452208 RepID=UPI003F89B004
MDRLLRPGRRFAYLGPEGTFTERALRSVPEAAGSLLTPAATAREALALVCRADVDAAMLPVHNTVAGTVPDTLRAIAESPALTVLREVVLGIEFALLVRPGTRLARIRTVSGHPHARRQVGGWLDRHVPQARWASASSNAEAARRVRDGECDAAVAGEFTAAHYGLQPAATGIQDTAGATTRFLLCARSGRQSGPAPGPADRTSLIGRLDARPEDIDELLDGLRRHPILRAVSPHVVPDGRSGSLLLADCPGRLDQPPTARAVGLLRLRVPGLRSLGSYPSAADPYDRYAPPDPFSPYDLCHLYERSKTMDTMATTGATGPAEPAPEDIARLREQIDDLDRSLIGTLKQRLRTSREIQRLRTGRGGSHVDSGREHTIRGRYAEELGEGGAGLAEALLELCRGQSSR